jgi:glycosyltransferase involved in cell wall biosynthesis
MLAAIWPTIVKTLPDAKLQIVGEWTEKSRAEKSGPTVAFTGFVEDLSKTLSGGVMLVPVRIGSGIRVKILIALALGVPVVSTTIGNEGIDVADGKEVLLRDDPASFAAAAIELARNPTLWRSLAAAGKEVVQKNYAPETVRRQRNEIYAELRARHAASKP